jgi:type II secretory pathway pseudopilin PulG
MKFKRSYKIFIAFTLTSLLVVVLMVGLVRFYVARNFADYVNKSSLERYSDFAAAQAAEYQTQKGWQNLKDNPGRWQEMLRSNLPRKNFENRKRPPRTRAMENNGSGSGDQDMPTPRSARRIQRLARRLG